MATTTQTYEAWQLVVLSEAAEDVGVSTSFLKERKNRDENFPQPIADISLGKIYDLVAIREYMQAKPKLATRRRLSLQALDQQSASVFHEQREREHEQQLESVIEDDLEHATGETRR